METRPDDACVVAVFDALAVAEGAVHILGRAGFSTGQISLVAGESSLRSEVVQKLRLGDDSLHDAVLGGGLGSIVGLLAGAGLLVFSTGTVVLLVGPIAGAVVGSIVGAFLGGMLGWGVHAMHIQQYENEVAAGKVLVIATGSPQQLDDAQRILQETAATRVELHARSSEDSPGIME